jgi:hypothetical protein
VALAAAAESDEPLTEPLAAPAEGVEHKYLALIPLLLLVRHTRSAASTQHIME